MLLALPRPVLRGEGMVYGDPPLLFYASALAAALLGNSRLGVSMRWRVSLACQSFQPTCLSGWRGEGWPQQPPRLGRLLWLYGIRRGG
ncbi:MAG: hypothetical protein DRJ96_05455 [Thermoprotei archaeon]|nr:MAG: hypothetical protein DRJ67_05330 [Thermoprotei archaeon]RLE96835.1 MAG: hypothetical protein DRJ96_05455 [Thermoprotei archaeon]